MPVSSKQTRAKAATPSRITSFDGSAKQRRRWDLLSAGLHDHSGPGLKAIPALAAGPTSLVTSTRSGSLSHRKMPPFGFHIFSTAVPNSRSTASTIVSSFSCRVLVRPSERAGAAVGLALARDDLAHDLRDGDHIAEAQGLDAFSD